MSVFTRATE